MKLSEETKRKISESVKKKGAHRNWTDEQRAEASKIFSERMKGNIPHNKLDKDKAQSILDELFPNKLEVIEYINSTKITYKCLSCGSIYTKAMN